MTTPTNAVPSSAAELKALADRAADTFFACDRASWLRARGLWYLNVDKHGFGYVERRQYKRDVLSVHLTPPPPNAASRSALARALLASRVTTAVSKDGVGYKATIDGVMWSDWYYRPELATAALLDTLLAASPAERS